MNAFVKKEIRSLLPAWIAILLLDLVLPWFSDQPDATFAILPYLFFGSMVILAIDSFGREFSSGTFSLLLAQPMERRQIWRTKMAVLFFAVAFIFIIYLFSCWLRLHLAFVDSDPRRAHVIAITNRLPEIFWYAMFQSVIAALVAVTGALWTMLLLRQVATAFWIAFLTPMGLAVTIALLIPEKFADAFEGIFYGVAILYSGFGFWLARRLFYRAQDAAWTGGVIAFSRWRYFESDSESFSVARRRCPIRALFRKEFQLHSIALIGAGALLGMHIAIFFLRAFYANFHKASTVAVLTDFFWVLWLVMPLVIGCMAVAEERKLGVTDEQFCLPVSRRLQFLIKFIPTMFFGILIGGIMPLLLEGIAAHLGDGNEIFASSTQVGQYLFGDGLPWFEINVVALNVVALSAGFALAAFFASTLAKNFLQALSITIVTIVGSILFIGFVSWVNREQPIIFGIVPWHSILPILIALLVVPTTLIWLAYLNFNYFQESKRLWRRNVIGISGALIFVILGSAAIYNRAWEIFEPVEPPHGAAKLSLSNPPKMRISDGGITVLLPDDRAWLDYIGITYAANFTTVMRLMLHPMPSNLGPGQLIHGTNWIQVTTEYGKTIGIKSDGTLWASSRAFMWPERSNPKSQLELTSVGNENDWQALDSYVNYAHPVYLLKTNHTLWEWNGMLPQFKADKSRASLPRQVGTNSDWAETFLESDLLRKIDGTVWAISWEHDKMVFVRKTNFDEVNFQTLSDARNGEEMAYIGKDGRLMVFNWKWPDTKLFVSCGSEANWVAVSVQWPQMTALKSDGTLWKWNLGYSPSDREIVHLNLMNISPTRVGVHNDWVAIADSSFGTISLAADGSLWLWPSAGYYYYDMALMKLPKQPEFLGNVLVKAN